VPTEHLDQLFAPLYRLDAARSRVSGGSGLGLAVSEAIVRAHGGSIAAEQSPLGGLTIRIDLPREAGA
jgi:signal transduction histidine kinase